MLRKILFSQIHNDKTLRKVKTIAISNLIGPCDENGHDEFYCSEKFSQIQETRE